MKVSRIEKSPLPTTGTYVRGLAVPVNVNVALLIVAAPMVMSDPN
jgi:hypothetical protein